MVVKLLPFIFLIGCDSISIVGIRDYIIYQGEREIKKHVKEELQNRFEEDYTIRYEEYKEDKKCAFGYFDYKNKSYIYKNGNFLVTNKGNLRFRIKEEDPNGSNIVDVLDNEVDFGISIGINSIKFKLEVGNFDIIAKTRLDNLETDFLLRFILRF